MIESLTLPFLLHSIRSLGPIVLLVTTLITILLLVIPRASPDDKDVYTVGESRKPVSPEMFTDWMYFWRSIMLLINLMAAIISIAVIYVHWIAKSMARLKAPSIEVLYLSETEKQKSKPKEKTKSKKKIKKNIQSEEEET